MIERCIDFKPFHCSVTPSHADAAKTYDILIEIADPAIRTSHSLLRALAPNAPISQEIMKLDDQIASLASSIRTSVYQHTLLSNFSNNPVTFMNEWMESQSLDLQDLLDPDPSKFKGTEGEWKLERLRDSDWFKQDWVKQAVGLHVARAQAVPPR
jgi:SWI/SNF-related matrix-associated actin-dependent regulator of chromatin subfamily D